MDLTAELTTPVSASIYIRATTATEQATLVLQLAAVDPPPLAAAFDDSRPIVLTGYSGLVATVNSGGGRGNYRYGLMTRRRQRRLYDRGDGRALELDGRSGYADDLDGGGDGQ